MFVSNTAIVECSADQYAECDTGSSASCAIDPTTEQIICQCPKGYVHNAETRSCDGR